MNWNKQRAALAELDGWTFHPKDGINPDGWWSDRGQAWFASELPEYESDHGQFNECILKLTHTQRQEYCMAMIDAFGTHGCMFAPLQCRVKVLLVTLGKWEE